MGVNLEKNLSEICRDMDKSVVEKRRRKDRLTGLVFIGNIGDAVSPFNYAYYLNANCADAVILPLDVLLTALGSLCAIVISVYNKMVCLDNCMAAAMTWSRELVLL